MRAAILPGQPGREELEFNTGIQDVLVNLLD